MGSGHPVVTPITPNIGAEVSGVDLAALSEASVGAIAAALIEHKALVFRDQHLTAPQYVDFMRNFGEPVPEDRVPERGNPVEIGAIHIRANEHQTINFWHMDHSFREHPSPQLSLYAQILPECGGDTLFANLEAAYDALPEETKDRISALFTNHKVALTQNSKRRHTEAQLEAMMSAAPIRHPLVARNPENARKYLFVNTPLYCRNIDGMENEEGDRLLQQLYRHAQRPEFQFRLTWKPRTLVVWENAHCLHYPVADYFPRERKLWRIAIRGIHRPEAAH